MEQLSLFETNVVYSGLMVVHPVVFMPALKKIGLLSDDMDEIRYKNKLIGYVSICRNSTKDGRHSYTWQDANKNGGEGGPARTEQELTDWLNIKLEAVLSKL